MWQSIRTLLSSVVDYAGLFPPAMLDLPTAMTNYAQDQRASHRWMLGRFVLPLSRWQEFVALLPTVPLEHWSLSVILAGHLDEAIAHLPSLTSPTVTITALEIPPLAPEAIKQLLSRLPDGLETFFELPLSEDLAPYLTALQSVQAAAKLRTGGITANAVPTVSQVSQAIAALANAQIPFKATAGLHHPLRGEHRLTYELDSASTVMHGFLNVAIAAALAYWHLITPTEMIELLQKTTLESFQFTETGVAWGDRHLILSQIATVRHQFLRSFGSCSVQEPIRDLQELKLL